MHVLRSVALILAVAGCNQNGPTHNLSVVNGNVLKLGCSIATSNHAAEITLNQDGNVFSISVVGEDQTVLFSATRQRPSLGVRTENNACDNFREYVEFNTEGLETIPVVGSPKFEMEFALDTQNVVFDASEKVITLSCKLDRSDLLNFLDLVPQTNVVIPNTETVAFDIDDTLMFTSPAFARGFAAGGTPGPRDILFWTHTNGCDAGCPAATVTLPDGTIRNLPANAASTPKTKALELVRYHLSKGHKVYAITARPDINGEPLRQYLHSAMGIQPEDIYFEPDLNQPGNPAGKTDRIAALKLDVFYGDSDSDITDALKAFSSEGSSKKTRPIRFLRSPFSSNRKGDRLNKYHPGYFGETIITDSY